MASVRPALLSDALAIAKNIRQADAMELSLYDFAPIDALKLGFYQSLQPLTVLTSSGSPCAMFGVALTPRADIGSIWLLGTSELFKIRVPFLRQSAMWLEHISRPFSETGNWVDSRNKQHIRWLTWLGFTTSSTITVKDTPVHYFQRRKST